MSSINCDKTPLGKGFPLSHQTKQVVLNVIKFFMKQCQKIDSTVRPTAGWLWRMPTPGLFNSPEIYIV